MVRGKGRHNENENSREEKISREEENIRGKTRQNLEEISVKTNKSNKLKVMSSSDSHKIKKKYDEPETRVCNFVYYWRFY